MPIVGLTDRTPSFKEIGRLRLGISQAEMKRDKSGPKELPYFRADFRPDCAESAADFTAAYTDKPTRINVRFPFPQIDRVWDANYEVYNRSGMLGMSDGVRWVYLRHNQTGELLVKDGVPQKSDGCKTDDNGALYLPFDKKTPVYSYTSQSGKDVPVYASPTGRLKLIVPELRRAAYVMLITRSVYNCIHITEQMAAIAAVAQTAGLSLPMIPVVLERRQETISVSIGGKKSMQQKYLVNLEIDPAFMAAHFNALSLVMPGQALPALPAPAPIEVTDITDLDEQGEFDDDTGYTPDPDPEPAPPPAQAEIVFSETLPAMDYETAAVVTNAQGVTYGSLDTVKLSHMHNSIAKRIRDNSLNPAELEGLQLKQSAIQAIMMHRLQDGDA